MRALNVVKRSGRFGLAFLLVLCLVPLVATTTGIAQDNPGGRKSLPEDWTHRSVVFSAPDSIGVTEKVRRDPRFELQSIRHGMRKAHDAPAPETLLGAAVPGGPEQSTVPGRAATKPAKKPKPGPVPVAADIPQDWSSALPAGAKVGDGMYPAKFSFDVNANPDCTNDYVAFNTSLAGVAAVAASQTGTFTKTGPSNGQTATIGGTLVLTASSTTNTGTFFLIGGTLTEIAANFAAAIVRNGSSVGVTASSAVGVVTVTATAAGTAGNSITLAKTLGNFAWTAATLAGGADGVPNIVAYNNLYSESGGTGYCSGTGPAVYWSYFTNTRSAQSSSVLSLDGTKIIYASTSASGAVVHILKWKANQGTVTAPVAPDLTIAAWGNCTAGNSCVVNVPLTANPQATNSAPFYDYIGAVLYIGDDTGKLHKITPVLTGTPAEVTTGGWPVTVDNTHVLNSPVYDSVSGKVFVTSSINTCSVTVSSVAHGCATALATAAAIVDPAIVDSSTQRVFEFSMQGGGQVRQFDTSLGNLKTATVSPSANTNPVFMGAFDHAYYNSGTGDGKLYVCGKAPLNNNRATLYRISIAAGVMATAADTGSLVLVNGGGGCSPITEFYNDKASTDWLFLSVGTKATTPTGATCSTANIGCVVSLNLTTLGATWPPASMTAGYVTPGVANLPSTSGIVIDNYALVASYPQASSLYFSFGANSVAAAPCNGAAAVGCAVKLTQAGLQ